MVNKTILVVDDEIRIRRLVSSFLLKSGYEVLEAADGEEALSTLLSKKDSVALVILDVMMPGMDGFETLIEIKKHVKTPVIMLTAKSEEEDQLKGFRLGADDYVTKPFSPSVLVAKVNSILRRTEDTADKLACGNIVINEAAHEVHVAGALIQLTHKEFELLKYLMENKGIALSRERILNAVWNYDYFGDLRTVDTHIKQLRAKLGEEGEKITTVRSIGYKFTE